MSRAPAAPTRSEAPPGGQVSGRSGSPSADGQALACRRELESELGSEDGSRRRAAGLDPTDPMARTLALAGIVFDRTALAGPPQAAPASAVPRDAVALASQVSLEHVMSRFVRRVAWSGDAHSGTARLELGAGALSGATLTIHSEHGEVRVSLELPPGVDAAAWRERIARRLGARGLQVAALDVG